LSQDEVSITPFADVNAIIAILRDEIRDVFEDQFVGIYLHGSLAIGDFDPESSDIDYLVVTKDEISEQDLSALVAMHAQFVALDSKWSIEIEGSYIPQKAVRRFDPDNCHHPRIERGDNLRIASHDSDWVIQRYIIYHRGIVVEGPPPKKLIDPVFPDDLRRAVLDLQWWWELQLSDTSRIRQSGYQAYAVLSMCRMLYTLEYGAIATKPEAARWAKIALRDRWTDLIIGASQLWPGIPMNRLDETMEFIQFTLDRCRLFGAEFSR